jgi:hypothetical protein
VRQIEVPGCTELIPAGPAALMKAARMKENDFPDPEVEERPMDQREQAALGALFFPFIHNVYSAPK